MTTIRGFLLRCLGFVVLLCLLYPFAMAAMSYLLPRPYTPNLAYPLNDFGHMRTRMIDAKRHPPVDIVFLGSSHAYRGFDPRIWSRRGYRCFNLGSSAQSPIQTEIIVKSAVPRLKPRLAIMEVHPMPFQNTGVESGVEFIANRPWDAHTLRMVAEVPDVVMLNAFAFGAIRKAIGFDDRFVEPRRRKMDTYVDGGFVQRDPEHFSKAAAQQNVTKDCDPSAKQWSAFQRLLAALNEQGIEVVLVEAPVTDVMRKGMYRGHERFAERMASTARYIDMNGKVALDDSLHFFTKGHLNQAGVELFNAALIDTLEGRGWLPGPIERPR